MPTKTINNGLFIFRRDLRIVDNTTLNSLAKICRNIYTIFIFTPEQVGNSNQYKSNNSVQFMIESLSDLAHHISNSGGKLHTLFGKNKTKVWTKYTLHPNQFLSMSVCKACYKEVYPQKEVVDYGLPSG